MAIVAAPGGMDPVGPTFARWNKSQASWLVVANNFNFIQTPEESMPKDAHNKAAEHHEKAATTHRMAAEHHGKGDHSKGHEHSSKAQEHSESARQQSEMAHKKSSEHAKSK
jgi:hypothetical protein